MKYCLLDTDRVVRSNSINPGDSFYLDGAYLGKCIKTADSIDEFGDPFATIFIDENGIGWLYISSIRIK